MMNCKLNLVIVISLLFCIEAFSQQSIKPQFKKSYWIDTGYGWSSRGQAFTGSLNLELSKGILLTLSYEQTYHPPVSETVSTHFGFIYVVSQQKYKPGYDINTTSLKFGKIIKGAYGLMTFSAGISSLKATKYSISEIVGASSGIGASFDVKFIPSLRTFGLAFNPFYNVNNIQHYGGLTINLAIGRLKRLK